MSHTTNYVATFIRVADDCPVSRAEEPPVGGTVAARQLAMLIDAPYRYTSDDVVFQVHADRRGIPAEERAAARAAFFSKGQPCLRSSPLAKRYGWGFHFDDAGRVALVASGTARYDELLRDEGLVQKAAMRSRRA